LNSKLDEIEVSKSSELHAVTHDMKTPLTILLSYLEAIESDRILMTKEVVLTLKEEVYSLNRLIESVNKGSKEYLTEEINLSDLVIEHATKFKSIFDTKHINLILKVDSDVTIIAERESISRIVYNLLSNSFYYSNPRGSVTVSLSENEKVILSISDTGIGIEDKYLKDVFKKNFRIESSRNLHKKGSGLGLYIIDLLVKDLSAEIEVLSEVGLGTEFKIYFDKSTS